MQRADIQLESLIAPPTDLWNRKWFLLSAGDFQSGDYNCMTVSWGGLGTMWNKPLALVMEFANPACASLVASFQCAYRLRAESSLVVARVIKAAPYLETSGIGGKLPLRIGKILP